MEIPGDVWRGDVLVKLSGNHEVLIENYKGMQLYTSEEIVITCKNVILHIQGEQLHICYFSGCDMKVTGTIHAITYRANGELCC